MKKLILSAVVFSMAFSGFGQTTLHKNNVTVGGGSQKYSGDLGNGITFENRVWRGGVGVTYSRYLNKSFDVSAYNHIGDLGYCQPHDMINKVVPEEDRCDGCVDRLGLGNLSSRMFMSGVLVKYKFSNGYLLNESSRFQPFMGFGLSMNKMVDRMKMNCVNPGNYWVLNLNAGVSYQLNSRFTIGYTVNTGYFLSDEMDLLSKGNTNDGYLQNNITIGFSF